MKQMLTFWQFHISTVKFLKANVILKNSWDATQNKNPLSYYILKASLELHFTFD